METTELLLRISSGFLVLFILTRIMGRKEISQMTFFNFTSAIAIGSIAGSFILSPNVSILNGVLALIGWTVYTLIMDFIDIKSIRGRKIVTGDPLIVIKDGNIVERTLKRSRLDYNSLNSMLRQQNTFSIADVEYAIFETNGKLSVMKKENKQPLTKGDMNIPGIQKIYPIPTEVISDGKILEDNLTKLALDTSWLKQQLKSAGINSVSEVSFAQIQTDGSLYIDIKDEPNFKTIH